jgi:hypothetical protein
VWEASSYESKANCGLEIAEQQVFQLMALLRRAVSSRM